MLELGGTEAIKQEWRESRPTYLLESILQDVRYAVRTLRKSPGFTAVAILTLALGIGMNTAIFSVVNAVLFEPLPFHNAGRLVQLWETEGGSGSYYSGAPRGTGPLTGPAYMDWHTESRTLASSSAYFLIPNVEENLSGVGEAQAVRAVKVQRNFFTTLGVSPFLGRAFAKGEGRVGHDQVAVLSYGLWRDLFPERPGAIGQQVELNGRPYSVIGVMPRWFNFPADSQLWIPLSASEINSGGRGNHHLLAIARMKKGVAPAQVEAELNGIEARRVGSEDANKSVVIPLQYQLTRTSRTELLVLLGAVALVLLIACANLANLFLARGVGRQQEFAIRAALGAGRARLSRQLLTESVTLAFAGAVLGIFGAWEFTKWAQSAKWLPIPRVRPITVDWRVLLFAISISALVGMLFGLAPALQVPQTRLSEKLKSGGRAIQDALSGRGLLRDSLVVSEVALALSLLIGAGLLLRTFSNMRSTNIGIRTSGVLTAGLSLPDSRYQSRAARAAFIEQLLSRVGRDPGVTAAALSWNIPLERNSNGYITVPGNSNPELQKQIVEWNYVTEDYFQAYSIPLLEGRSFNASDAQEAETADDEISKWASHGGGKPFPSVWYPAVINRVAAQTFWPGQDAVGKTFSDGSPCKVIGIVGDVRKLGITHRTTPEVYFPYTLGLNSGDWQLTVKAAVKPLSLLPSIRGSLASLDGMLALSHPRTMRQVVADQMQETALQTAVLGLFATLALLLAAIGIYGVMTYLVNQRRHEIGIRMALGAHQRDILLLILGRGARLMVVGVAIGIAGSLALTRLMSSLLFDVSTTDPMTFAGVVGVLVVIGLTACYVPARRAMRVDPVVALRQE
jgi:putative ABC transport system permease protein